MDTVFSLMFDIDYLVVHNKAKLDGLTGAPIVYPKVFNGLNQI